MSKRRDLSETAKQFLTVCVHQAYSNTRPWSANRDLLMEQVRVLEQRDVQWEEIRNHCLIVRQRLADARAQFQKHEIEKRRMAVIPIAKLSQSDELKLRILISRTPSPTRAEIMQWARMLRLHQDPVKRWILEQRGQTGLPSPKTRCTNGTTSPRHSFRAAPQPSEIMRDSFQVNERLSSRRWPSRALNSSSYTTSMSSPPQIYREFSSPQPLGSPLRLRMPLQFPPSASATPSATIDVISLPPTSNLLRPPPIHTQDPASFVTVTSEEAFEVAKFDMEPEEVVIQSRMSAEPRCDSPSTGTVMNVVKCVEEEEEEELQYPPSPLSPSTSQPFPSPLDPSSTLDVPHSPQTSRKDLSILRLILHAADRSLRSQSRPPSEGSPLDRLEAVGRQAESCLAVWKRSQHVLTSDCGLMG